MKKILLAFIAFLFIIGTLGCGNGQTTDAEVVEDKWAEIEERGTIIIGFDDAFVPMGFKDTSGEIVGFDIDLAKEAAQRLNLEPEFQPIDWNLKEQELNTGNIDLIWNGYSITDERKKAVNFTNPYLDNSQSIVVMSDSDIESKADLEGRIVSTQNSSSGLTAIEDAGVAHTFDGGEAVLFDTYPDAFMDLEAGRVEAIVADEILARYYTSQRGEENYKILEEDFGDEQYGVGVRKGDADLLEKLNDVLDEMKEDGSAADISQKWFEENIIK